MSTRPLVRRFGSWAYYLEFRETEPRRIRAAARRLSSLCPGSDVVVGSDAIVVVDPPPAFERILVEALDELDETESEERSHVVDVVYDGPDLDFVAHQLGLDRARVVALHHERLVHAELLGFLPGFAYLGPVDDRLVVPRRATPRPRVAANSVALAGRHTGIYPFDSPGGWQLIGRAVGFSAFDPEREPSVIFRPGDRVEFRELSVSEAGPPEARIRPRPDAPVRAPALRFVATTGLVTVQDGGRPGRLALGIPPSGPLDPETFANSNRALGNAAREAALEVVRGTATLRAEGSIVVSLDGKEPTKLRDGEIFAIAENDRAVRYLAVRGGLDVPERLGARATLLVARLGGHLGRACRAGDVIGTAGRVGDASDRAASGSVDDGASSDGVVALEVERGPHEDRFVDGAFEDLLAAEFVVSELGDRVGQRLAGTKLARHTSDVRGPTPLVRGAIQVTTDGTPIVLGPDHPTTGGYPLIAVVEPGSWGALARARPGRRVRFVARG